MGGPYARSRVDDDELGLDDAFGELDWSAAAQGDPSVPESSTRSAHTRKTLRRGETELELEADIGEEEASAGSGVAPRADRVAEMRDLYARGETDAALAIAATLEAETLPPPPIEGADAPDASLYIEVAEEEMDVSAFGGLIPIDEDDLLDEQEMTCVARSTTSLPPGPALRSLTERQGIPRMLKAPHEIAALRIDHRAGFLLGMIDGMQTMEEILDVCAMPPGEALELIRSLVDMGVIEID